jgi:putative transposase
MSERDVDGDEPATRTDTTIAEARGLAVLDDQERAEALRRLVVLRASDDGVPAARLARQLDLAVRTVQRWVAQYRAQGLVGLARKTRSDTGTRQLPPDQVALIEGLALRRPRPSVATIHRQVAAVARERGWPVPSYARVYDIVRALDPALLTLAHGGTKAYGEAYDLVVRREASRPNEVWQADHTPLDLWVRDDKGRPVRPWLTIILDDYSRAVAGYALNVQPPSALQTALALRQAIWRKAEPPGSAGWTVCGIPCDFYTDHGSDFTSRHLEQVAADLHIHLIFSIPGAPRGRGKIERFFDTVNHLFLATLPGYTPPGTAPPAHPTLTLSDLDARLRRFIVGDYHPRPHGETGEPPQVRWEAGGFLPQLPETLEQLDLLLLTVAKARRVQRDGIHVAGLRFSDPTLAAYVGEDVMIRYDPRDMAEIRVFHDGLFLCCAVCQDLAGQTVGFKEVIQARNERRRSLLMDLSDRARVVEMFLSVHQEEAPTDPAPPPAAPHLKRYYNSTQDAEPGAVARSLRPQQCWAHPDRDARHREAIGALPATLLARRLRASVPHTLSRGDALHPGAQMGATELDARAG